MILHKQPNRRGIFRSGGCINSIVLFILISTTQAADGGFSNINEFGARVLNDVNTTFSKPANVGVLLLAGGSSAILHNSDADKNIDENLRHRAFNETTSDFFDYAGNPLTHLGASGLWYLFSEDNDRGRDRAATMLSALVITDAAASGFKVIVGNERPNGDGLSFPSVHTASSFCLASVLDEFYGPQIGIPAYLGAAMVGWRMLDNGEHWASDVLFGATLGYMIGHSIAGEHKTLQLAGFHVEPMMKDGVCGITFVKHF